MKNVARGIKESLTYDAGRCSSRTFETRSCHFWFPWYLRHIRQSWSRVDPTTIDKSLEWTSRAVNAADFYQTANTRVPRYSNTLGYPLDHGSLSSAFFNGDFPDKLIILPCVYSLRDYLLIEITN